MRAYEGAAIKTATSLAMLNFGQSLIITSGLLTVMVMAALGVQNGTLSVGDFVMVNAYMIQITMPLNFLGTVYREIRQSLIDMGEMFDLLEQPQEVTDRPGAKELEVTGGEVVLDDIVEFLRCRAADPERRVDHRVPAGRKTVAIVGPSGSGKSTIGRLLFRFYDVASGSLRIDGQDSRRDPGQPARPDRRRAPGHGALQRHDPLQHRLRPARGQLRGEIVAAAKAAKIHDFIEGLPDGYETTVGERGLKLSGGEKQRVGIARTLLKNPPILILDEATSALDSETESSIQDALKLAGEGRTVITIAHRLSTVADADRIVVLENGKVVEQGAHDTLLARDGRYAALWNRQMQEDVAPEAVFEGIFISRPQNGRFVGESRLVVDDVE